MEIPVLNKGMDLVRIPLDDNNEWAVEWLNDKAGILSYSKVPGEGTSIIAGHNHLDEMNVGPFLMLWQLENNDRIFITDDDGEFLMYSVYANELINPTDSALIYQKAIPGSLVLLTCENEMPEGGYAYRRAVFAEPLQ
jgi:LPXTG-site transpeptidase (sortase) family protein